jgi:hypothetical protein
VLSAEATTINIRKINSAFISYIIYYLQHYISDINIDANEYDFKKALDLLQYIDRVSGLVY